MSLIYGEEKKKNFSNVDFHLIFSRYQVLQSILTIPNEIIIFVALLKT